MKLSISAPFTATVSSIRPAASAWGFGRWFGASPPAPSTPTAHVYPPSLCRQALIEAIRQEKPHPEEQAALYWMLAESNHDLSDFGTEDWAASVGVDDHSPAATPEQAPLHTRPDHPGSDALSRLIVTPPVAVDKKPLVPPRRRVIRNPIEELGGFPNQDNFAAVASAYQSSGGIFRAEDLVRLAALGDGQGRAELIGQITSGRVLSFQWRQSYWVPIFQFESGGTVQKNCAREVIGELADTFDDWEKVVWFIQPNVWLDGAKPLELLEQQLPEVVDAARADKFVAVG